MSGNYLSVEGAVSTLNEIVEIVENINTVSGDYLPLSGGTLSRRLSSTSTAIIGEDNVPITDDSNIIGKENTTGSKAWYYKYVDFDTNTIYLTDQQFYFYENKEGDNSYDSSFDSQYEPGDVVSIVNQSKFDYCSTITAVDGNRITVDSLPFDAVVTNDSTLKDVDDFTVINQQRPDAGCVIVGITC